MLHDILKRQAADGLFIPQTVELFHKLAEGHPAAELDFLCNLFRHYKWLLVLPDRRCCQVFFQRDFFLILFFRQFLIRLLRRFPSGQLADFL